MYDGNEDKVSDIMEDTSWMGTAFGLLSNLQLGIKAKTVGNYLSNEFQFVNAFSKWKQQRNAWLSIWEPNPR
jgi:hypothetical protein